MCLHVGIGDLTGLAKGKLRFILLTTRNKMAAVGTDINCNKAFVKKYLFYSNYNYGHFVCCVT